MLEKGREKKTLETEGEEDQRIMIMADVEGKDFFQGSHKQTVEGSGGSEEEGGDCSGDGGSADGDGDDDGR